MQETQVQSLGLEYPLEEGIATHSGILAWSIPGTEEPGRLPSIGSQRIGMTKATEHERTHAEWKCVVLRDRPDSKR